MRQVTGHWCLGGTRFSVFCQLWELAGPGPRPPLGAVSSRTLLRRVAPRLPPVSKRSAPRSGHRSPGIPLSAVHAVDERLRHLADSSSTSWVAAAVLPVAPLQRCRRSVELGTTVPVCGACIFPRRDERHRPRYPRSSARSPKNEARVYGRDAHGVPTRVAEGADTPGGV
jgi:hypothetical protein